MLTYAEVRADALLVGWYVGCQAPTACATPVLLLRRIIPAPEHARCEVCATCVVFVERIVLRAQRQVVAAIAAVAREASYEQKCGEDTSDSDTRCPFGPKASVTGLLCTSCCYYCL